MTDYSEIQSNEVEALRSIYMDDFQLSESKRAAWNQSSEIGFSLRIRAFLDPEVAVTLDVRLPKTYPKTLPVLAVRQDDAVREKTKAIVQNIVRTKPVGLLGAEMIYEIASSIQDTLEEAAQALAEGKELPSLEEERAVQVAALEQVAKQNEAEMLRKKEEETAEEDRMLKLLVGEEVRRRQDKARSAKHRSRKPSGPNASIPISVSSTTSDVVIFDQPISIKGADNHDLWFRAVFGKTKMQSRPGRVVFSVKPVLHGDGSDVPLLILRESTFSEPNHSSSDFRQIVQSCEDKLDALKKLRHSNIIDFLDFKVSRSLGADADMGSCTWQISTLHGFANKGSLGEFLEISETVGASNLRAWTIQLLEAVDFYHRHGIQHGNITVENVFLSRSAPGATLLKLSSASEQIILQDSSWKSDVVSPKQTRWLAPELLHKESSDATSSSSKTDIWHVGLVFLQMTFGLAVLQSYSSPQALESACELSASLETFIHEIFRTDPRRRPTAFELLPFEFLRDESPVFVEGSNSLSGSNPTVKQPRLRHESSGNRVNSSRYANDFVEAGRLGKGGYGEVMKARNKLDGRFYAIKKITSLTTTLTETLSEIMLLSRLNHPYVVRYFTAWMESDAAASKDRHEDTTSSVAESSLLHESTSKDLTSDTGGLDFISSSGHPDIQFGYDSDEAEPRPDDSDDESSSTESVFESEGQNAAAKYGGVVPTHVRSSSSSKPTSMTLYIQMEYCEKQTLRDVIRNGLYDNIDEGWRLFRQILEGLSHIHRQASLPIYAACSLHPHPLILLQSSFSIASRHAQAKSSSQVLSF